MEEEKTAKAAALYKLLWFRNRPRRCGVCMKDRTALGPEGVFVCWRCDGNAWPYVIVSPWCASPECGCVD